MDERAQPPVAADNLDIAAADESEAVERTIDGRIVAASGRFAPDDVSVWFAYRSVDGDATTIETKSNAQGRFVFELPTEPLQSASIGAEVEGVKPVDLEPTGQPLEPGTVVLIVDDLVPSYLRYG